MKAVAVAFSMAWPEDAVESRCPDPADRALERLGSFRRKLHGCFTARADELFELADGAPRGAACFGWRGKTAISLPS